MEFKEPSSGTLMPETTGLEGVNAYLDHDSQPRQTMVGSHLPQAVVISNPTPIRDFTGVEREYGKYTHGVRMPERGSIVKVISKNPPDMQNRGNYINPLMTCIYAPASAPKSMLSVLQIPYHHCLHQHFGFRFKHTNIAKSIKNGDNIDAGTILAHTPNYDPLSGNYSFGIETPMATMTIPSVIEDGAVVCKQWLEKMKIKAYGTRTFSWGSKHIPLNLYGDEGNYKPFPDIGEKIRLDSLVFARREFNPIMAAREMSPKALCNFGHFDEGVHGYAGATVVDVEIYHGKVDHPVTLSEMNKQAEKYHNKTLNYYKEIIAVYNNAKRENSGVPPNLSPDLENLIVRAIAYTRQMQDSGKVQYQNVDQSLDQWSVKITYEYELTPTIGYKLTGLHGDKVVIVDIWDEEDMPIDDYGNRAMIIQDPDGTIRRMNLGRLYRQYFGASFTMMQKAVQAKVANGESSRMIWDWLKPYYDIISERHFNKVVKLYDADPTRHIEDICKHGIFIHMPTDSKTRYIEAVEMLQQLYPVIPTPVTYRGRSGNLVRTINPVMIGSIYILLLEKIGNVQSAVSSAKLQCMGVPAKISNIDKYATPGRQSAGRFMGETEDRLMACFIGPEFVAELADQSNNIGTHRFSINTLLRAPQPTNIDRIVDRTVIPRDGGRIVNYVTHIIQCSGCEFTAEQLSDEDNIIERTRDTYYIPR